MEITNLLQIKKFKNQGLIKKYRKIFYKKMLR